MLKSTMSPDPRDTNTDIGRGIAAVWFFGSCVLGVLHGVRSGILVACLFGTALGIVAMLANHFAQVLTRHEIERWLDECRSAAGYTTRDTVERWRAEGMVCALEAVLGQNDLTIWGPSRTATIEEEKAAQRVREDHGGDPPPKT